MNTKNKNRAKRIHKSAAARIRRKTRKIIVETRTLRLFARLRKKRQKAA